MTCFQEQSAILSRLRSFGLLRRLRGSRDGKAKFCLLVRRISVVTGRPHIKTNRVSGVNSKNLLHIQLDNYSRVNAHSTEKYTIGIDVHSTGEMIIYLSPRRVSPFLAWGDFLARLRFARSTVPEEKWRTTRSLVAGK